MTNHIAIYVSIATGSGHLDHPGQPGLTHLIKYLGLTRIWNRITCVILMMSHGDDVLNHVSILHQYILKTVIVDSVEAPRKVTLWVQVACMAIALAIYVARPCDAPGTYQCSIVAAIIIRTSISTRSVIWLGYVRLYLASCLVYKTNCC